MFKKTTPEYDWEIVNKKQPHPVKNRCKFILPKKKIRLAVLRNKIKRIVRHHSSGDSFFRIKITVNKKNYQEILEKIKNSSRQG